MRKRMETSRLSLSASHARCTALAWRLLIHLFSLLTPAFALISISAFWPKSKVLTGRGHCGTIAPLARLRRPYQGRSSLCADKRSAPSALSVEAKPWSYWQVRVLCFALSFES